MRRLFVLLALFFCIFFPSYSYADVSNDVSQKPFEILRQEHERNDPVFFQKGGNLRSGEHSIYFRTNDEWTGFSTCYFGYRVGITRIFSVSVEGGISIIPHVYIGAIHLNLTLFESPSKIVYIGTRLRMGYKYQDSDFSVEGWQWLGENYLEMKRNGIFIIPDLTVAFRFGQTYKRFCLYYTIYPRFEFDFFDRNYPFFLLFSPVTAGFEVRFGKYKFGWSFAIEAGYAFPIPWNSIPEKMWVNFPSLANVSLNYKFGDAFYKNHKYE